MEEIQKEMEDDILEFAKRMYSRWAEPRESLQRASSKDLLSTEVQPDGAEEVNQTMLQSY